MRFCLELILASAFLGNLAAPGMAASLTAGDTQSPRAVWVVKVDTRTGHLVRTLVVAPKPSPDAAPDVRGLIADAAKNFDVNPLLVDSVIQVESNYNPFAVSPKGAQGLMQLMPATADRVGPSAGVEQASLQLYDPSLNVRVGTAYLKDLFEMFGGDPFKAVAAYNAGEHAVQQWDAKYPGDDDQWVENIGFRETRDYVKRVIGGLREYRMLYPSPTASNGATQPRGPS